MGGFFSSSKSKEEIEMALPKAKDIVSSSPVVVFSKSYCPYCVRAKKLLEQLGATFKVIELDQEKLSNRTVSANLNSLPVLNGANFKKWKEEILIVLGCLDLDYALRVECPPSLTAASSSDQRKDFEKWERSNRISLMIIRRAIPETFRDTASECQNAKEFLAA